LGVLDVEIGKKTTLRRPATSGSLLTTSATEVMSLMMSLAIK